MTTTQIMLLGEYLESLKLSGGIGEVFDGRPYAEALEICIANLQFPIGMKTFRDVLSSKGITWKRPSTARNAREAAIALDADLRRREQEVEKRIQELQEKIDRNSEKLAKLKSKGSPVTPISDRSCFSEQETQI